ncbi:MAG TPA: FecR domain-containing protein [Steroidobacteraceae bacterium]|jgi:transmembrane sensor|nr:FecR domain-containing protein [Steroidobacteraceae bacterium]
MAHEPDPTTSLAEQAAYWWQVFHDGEASAAEHREFADWVARSPERVEAYLETARLDKALRAPTVRWPDTSAEQLIRDARTAPAEPVQLPRRAAAEPERREVRFTPRLGFALAASLIVAVGIAWTMLRQPEQYMTAFGEQRSVMLADGTRVTLNTASKIEVELGEKHRLVRLVQGEALFEVAHDPTRPFDVSAGNATVRAVGTQFNVDARPRQTTVTVVEGRVAFMTGKAPILVAGDRLVVDAAGTAVVSHGTNVGAALAWTRHQLVFERRALGEVAAEFNRYNRGRITIESASLREQEVTGVFQSNDPASFVAFLSSIPGVTIHDDGAGGHVISEQAR